MDLYKITADYLETRRMYVQVKSGEDPLDPDSWVDVVEENAVDYSLYDVLDAELEKKG